MANPGGRCYLWRTGAPGLPMRYWSRTMLTDLRGAVPQVGERDWRRECAGPPCRAPAKGESRPQHALAGTAATPSVCKHALSCPQPRTGQEIRAGGPGSHAGRRPSAHFLLLLALPSLRNVSCPCGSNPSSATFHSPRYFGVPPGFCGVVGVPPGGAVFKGAWPGVPGLGV